jgi:hypothetical protein
VPSLALREEPPSPSARSRHSGKRPPSPSARPRLSGKIFFKRFRPPPPSNANFFLRVPVFPECCTQGRWASPSASLPRVSRTHRQSGKPLFPECNSSPSATLGEEWLPRVPDFWHSGKYLTLGESCFSRSASMSYYVTFPTALKSLRKQCNNLCVLCPIIRICLLASEQQGRMSYHCWRLRLALFARSVPVNRQTIKIFRGSDALEANITFPDPSQSYVQEVSIDRHIYHF